MKEACSLRIARYHKDQWKINGYRYVNVVGRGSRKNAFLESRTPRNGIVWKASKR